MRLPLALALGLSLGPLWAQGLPSAAPEPPPEPTAPPEVAPSPEPTPFPEVTPTPTPALGDPPFDDPEALLVWGQRARAREGCTLAEAAWLRLVEDFPTSEWAAPALYLFGVCRENADDARAALDAYTRMVQTWPDDPMVKDALFRIGLVYEWQGEHRQALRQYRAMLRGEELELKPTDMIAVELQRDMQLLWLGRERIGVRRLQGQVAALAEGERSVEEEVSYFLAKAEWALAQELSRHAREIPLEVTGLDHLRVLLPGVSAEDILAERLQARSDDLIAARARYQALFERRQIDWNLAAVWAIGMDYEGLYRDLVAAPLPRGLSAEEREIYVEALELKARPIAVEAWRTYYLGVKVAREQGNRSLWARRLEERLEALTQEGFAEPGPMEEP